MRENYDNTGKRLTFEIVLSEDSLEDATYTSVYAEEIPGKMSS